MRITNSIIKPVITEKTVTKAGEYAFRINMRASKGSVANEVKKLYGVDPVKVRVMVVRGKKRRIPGTSRFRTTSNWKKAIVTLKDGQTIDLFAQGK